MTNKILREVWDKLDDQGVTQSPATEKSLDVSLSAKSLELVPGESIAELAITVVNQSDRRASFQVEILAAGQDPRVTVRWYDLSPEVSSVKPPGDTTQFRVALVDSPIVGFFGWVSLTVRVFSLELKAEERQVLRLKVVPPAGAIPLKLELLTPILRSRPGRTTRLPVRIYNLAQLTVGALVRCDGLPLDWFVQDAEQAIDLLPQQWTTTEFAITLPAPAEALAEALPLRVQAEVPGSIPAIAEGRFEILPVGRLAFRPPVPAQQRLPRAWRRRDVPLPARYELTFENASNLVPTVTLALDSETADDLQWALEPDDTPWLPGMVQVKTLQVWARRPWLGRTQTHVIEAQAAVSDERLGPPVPASRPLQLDVAPVVPAWLALLGGLGLLWLLWLLSWLNPANGLFGHQAAVNSVQFDGLGETIVSSSNDQTARFWRRRSFVRPLENHALGPVATADKAMRVARYRPLNNDQLAVGLENGQIQLWDLLRQEQLLALAPPNQRDDRVLDVLFTPNTPSLLSSHGSGAVLRWALGPEADAAGDSRLLQTAQFDFAAYSLAAVGPEGTMIAVAGRYNRLELWDWQTDERVAIADFAGGQDDYITSLATAAAHPNWLAVADNQGQITLLDLSPCLAGNAACRTLDRWAASEDGQSIRAIALTRSGCYLTSVGDDGQVKLWPLLQGRRHGRFAAGKTLARLPQPLNSVDIRLKRNQLWLVSGSDDSRVRVHRSPLQPTDCR